MHGTLFWSDAELLAPVREGADLLLRFAAAPFTPGGARPSATAGAGHVRALVLRLHDARMDPAAAEGGAWGDALGRLAQARLEDRSGAAGPRDRLPVPLRLRGALRLSLAFANGTRLEIAAAGLDAGFDGDPAYRESFAC